MWRCTANGFFTVRSAYHLQVEVQRRSQGQCSQSTSDRGTWSKIWKLALPPAAKIFLWRACLNVLPTKMNLFKKKIVDNTHCPLCLQENETTEHILWECTAASDVWGQCSKKIQKSRVSHKSLKELMVEMFLKLNKEEMEELAVILWKLWRRINEFVFMILSFTQTFCCRVHISRCKSLENLNMGKPISQHLLPIEWKNGKLLQETFSRSIGKLLGIGYTAR